MSQIKETFKAGDRVYFPKKSTKIYTLKEHTSSNYPIKIKYLGSTTSFTKDGKEFEFDGLPSIFHATRDSFETLVELYNVQFAYPKTFLETHLEKGSKVLCLVVKNLPAELPKYIWEINPNQCTVNVITNKKEGIYYNQYNAAVLQDIYPIAIDGEGKITYLDYRI